MRQLVVGSAVPPLPHALAMLALASAALILVWPLVLSTRHNRGISDDANFIDRMPCRALDKSWRLSRVVGARALP